MLPSPNASHTNVPPTFDIAEQSSTIVEAIEDELKNSSTGLEWVVDNINITYSYKEDDDNDDSSAEEDEDYDDNSASNMNDNTDEDDDDDDDDDGDDSDSTDSRDYEQVERSVALTTKPKTILSTLPRTTSVATTTRSTSTTTGSTTTSTTTIATTPQLTTVAISTTLPSPSTTTVPTTTDSSDEVTTAYTADNTIPEEWRDVEPDLLKDFCLSLYYTKGDSRPAIIVCPDDGTAISLEKLPATVDDSVCTIPLNLPLNESQTWNDSIECPPSRQYLRYSCPELVHHPSLLMQDYEYGMACCDEGQYYNTSEDKCVDCDDSCLDSDDSEDQNSGNQNSGGQNAPACCQT